MSRLTALVVAGTLVVGACGVGDQTLSEYATELESKVVAMNLGLDAIDAELESRPGIEGVHRYAERRVEIRNEFLEGIETMEPPQRLREFHETAIDVIRRLTAAETVLADEALRSETLDDAEGLWDSGAGLAARAVDEEALVICKAAQAEFDATEENAVAEGVPWIPAEMKEIVRVAFLCERSDRP